MAYIHVAWNLRPCLAEAMGSTRADDAGGRGSRELWLAAAYESLVEAGIDAVRIQALGKRVGLSRTSFYWFFQDRDALLGALLDLWREKNSGLAKQAAAYAESITEAILNVHDCWLDPSLFDSQFEFAVRSWALQSAAVAAEIEKADSARIAALASMFMRFGSSAVAADARARTIYLTQIGYISMKTREDLATRMRRIPHYVEVFTGTPPKPRDLARFYARHSFSPEAPGTSGAAEEAA